MIDLVTNGFQSAMRRVSTDGYLELNCGIPNFNQVVVEMARNFQPTLIFIQTQNGSAISAQTAQELSRIAFCMSFNGDIRYKLPDYYIQTEGDFHLSTFTNMRDVREARALGLNSEWLEIGVDPERFKRHPDPTPAPQIVFLGNNYGPGYFALSQFRIEAVERLKQEFGANFGHYGSGWADARGNVNGDQVAESKLYNGALVAVNISHFNVEKYSSDRLLRSMASGCAVVAQHYQDIESCYTPDVHLKTFNTLDEMVAQIRWLLEHPQEREQIAQAGMQHVVDNYSFDKMCENICLLYHKHKK